MSATIVQLKHIELMAKAASAQKTNLFAVRVIRIKTNSDGTAKNEPNAHTSGSAYGTFFLNLYVKLNDIRLVFKNRNFGSCSLHGQRLSADNFKIGPYILKLVDSRFNR